MYNKQNKRKASSVKQTKLAKQTQTNVSIKLGLSDRLKETKRAYKLMNSTKTLQETAYIT